MPFYVIKRRGKLRVYTNRARLKRQIQSDIDFYRNLQPNMVTVIENATVTICNAERVLRAEDLLSDNDISPDNSTE